MTKAIVIFDTQCILDRLSPVTYAEFGSLFLLISIPANQVGNEDWAKCSQLLHYCLQNNISVEFWVLHKVGKEQGNSENLKISQCCLKSLVEKAPIIIKDNLIKTDNATEPFIKVKHLIWAPCHLFNFRANQYINHYYHDIEIADICYLPPIVIQTDITGQQYTQAGNHQVLISHLDEKFLLPIAILFLKYQTNIIGRANNINPYQLVYIAADEKQLLAAISNMFMRYKIAQDYLNQDYDKAIYDISTELFYPLNIDKNIETALPKFRIKNLDIGLFYLPYQDDEKVKQWFADQLQHTITQLDEFTAQLEIDYDNCLTQLNQVNKTYTLDKLAQNLNFLESIQDSNIKGNDKHRLFFTSVKNAMTEQLLHTKSVTYIIKEHNFLDRLEGWRKSNLDNLLRYIRFRPTIEVTIFSIVSILFLICMVSLYATNNITNSLQTITFLPVQYHFLILMIFACLVATLLLAAFVLYTKQRKYQKALSVIKSQLMTIHTELTDKCNAEIDAKKSMLVAYMQGKNLTLFENIEKSQKQKSHQYEFTKNMVNNYVKYCDLGINSTNSLNLNIINFNAIQNMTDISELYWQPNPKSTNQPVILIVNSPVNTVDSSILNKFNGLAKIQFTP